MGHQGIEEALEVLEPSRLVDAHRILESDGLADKLIENNIPLVITPTRAKRLKYITDTYPIRALVDKKLALVISADTPTLTDVNLTQVYQEMAEIGALTIQEINELALNALHYSFLEDEVKAELIGQFKTTYQELEAKLSS